MNNRSRPRPVHMLEFGRSLRNFHHLSSASIVLRSDGFVDAEVDQEIVALSIEHGRCYGLNRVGSRVWKLVANPVRVSDLCAILISEYMVDPDVCERQTLDLLEELRAEGLITTPAAECRRWPGCGGWIAGQTLTTLARECSQLSSYMVRIIARNGRTVM
jgi:hypothetical protein